MKISRLPRFATTFAPLLIALASLVHSLPAHAQGSSLTAVPSAEELQTLVVREIAIGQGEEAVAGRPVEVHYTGWLYDPAAPGLRGRKFDSSLDRNRPFTFPLGAGRVIKGWDQGVAGMKVGGKRLLIIPGHLAYGSRGAGGGLIPPDAILLFEVELLRVL